MTRNWLHTIVVGLGAVKLSVKLRLIEEHLPDKILERKMLTMKTRNLQFHISFKSPIQTLASSVLSVGMSAGHGSVVYLVGYLYLLR